MKKDRVVPSFSSAVRIHRPFFKIPLLASLLFCSTVIAQGPVALNGSTIEPYFLFPASPMAALISFDWDAANDLHYSVGDPNYGLKLEVSKQTDSGPETVFQSSDVWAGSQLACIAGKVYFNDGGDFLRSDFNYFLYDAAGPGPVMSLLAAPYGASLWGLTARGADEFFASGSDSTWGPAAIFHSRVTTTGLLESSPPVNLGEVGESPGPIAFGPTGDLLYVPGYAMSATATIYRWSGEEVNAAIADPVASRLQADGHQWAALPAPFSGATGIATDSFGNVYVTATAWGAPSQLIVFSGNSPAPMPIVAAEYNGRLETVRYRENAVYFSCAEGVFRLPMLAVASSLESTAVTVTPGETALFSIAATGGVGEKNYQWYRRSADKTSAPVGGNLPHFSITARMEDSGDVYYCVVTDAISSVESPHFTLTVQEPVPLATRWALISLFTLITLFGSFIAARNGRSIETVNKAQ